MWAQEEKEFNKGNGTGHWLRALLLEISEILPEIAGIIRRNMIIQYEQQTNKVFTHK